MSLSTADVAASQARREQSALERLVAEQEARIAEQEARIAELQKQNERLRELYWQAAAELKLVQHRIYKAKAERVNTDQLELQFAELKGRLNRLAKALGDTDASNGEPAEDTFPGDGEPSESPGDRDPSEAGDGNNGAPERRRPKPKGRRNLRKLELPEVRVEVPDPTMEELVQQGKAQRIGFEDSYSLGYQRGGARRVVTARVKYRLVGEDGTVTIATAPLPPRVFRRSLLAPSLVAHVMLAKFCDGLPLFRIEQQLEREGASVDRGTLSRVMEEGGAALSATIVKAMKDDALANAFCIATDATGILIQPTPNEKGGRQACRRGHFFVMLADSDHVIIEYTPKHSSAFVNEFLGGFVGYVQADASSVYDALFRPFQTGDPEEDKDRVRPSEVGCWSHARRYFWEAATTTKDPIALEGLYRIRYFYELEERWKGKPPKEILRLRQSQLRPVMDDFFAWAESAYKSEEERRGPLRSALGYAVRQQEPLRKPLENGRLPLDNNRSERALRLIAVGRKAWLFCGSDDHAESAAGIFSLVSSARLHGLDPGLYLTEVLRVLPHWPRDRYIELSPKYWLQTRSRLDPAQLSEEYGFVTVPPPLDLTAPTPVA